MAKSIYRNGQTSNIVRVKLMDTASATGAGKTGLSSSSAGLIISTIAENEATPTVYTQAAGNIEAITTLGTFAAPTASKCRFKEVDATNHPGLYELQFADARFAVTNANSLIGTLSGASGMAQVDFEIQQRAVPADLIRILGTLLTETVPGYLAAALKKLFDVAVPVFTAASVNQTGDSYARIGTNGAGLNALGDSRLAFLPNLDVAVSTRMAAYTQPIGFLAASFQSTVASSTEVIAIQNNTRCVRVVPVTMERPDTGTTVFRVELLLYDDVGNMEAPDSAPTISVVNQSGTSRDANLDSTTMALVSTGRYRSTYTMDTVHAIEQLMFAFSVVEGGATRSYGNTAQVVDTTAVDFTSTDRTALNSLVTNLGTPNSTIAGDIALIASDSGFSDYGPTTQSLRAAYQQRLTIATDALAAKNQTTAAAIRTDLGMAAASFDTTMAAIQTAANTAATQSTAANVASAAIKVVSDKYATMIVVDGGVYQFTANALELGPAGGGGGGGDATLANQAIIINDIAELANAGPLIFSGPVRPGVPSLYLVNGDDYFAADGRSLEWEKSNWPDLTGAAIAFTLEHPADGTLAIDHLAGAVITPTGTAKVRVELTSAQTDPLLVGSSIYRFLVLATLATSSHKVTLAEGLCTVTGPRV